MVVALGLALRVVADFVVAEWVSTDAGWFAYEPLSDQLPSLGTRPVAAALVWLACTAVWAAVSVWLLGPRNDADG